MSFPIHTTQRRLGRSWVSNAAQCHKSYMKDIVFIVGSLKIEIEVPRDWNRRSAHLDKGSGLV